MDRVSHIILELKKLNASISVAGDELKIEAGKGTIHDGLKEEIRANKHNLIRYINKLRNKSDFMIPSVAPQASYPLSSSQMRLWVMSQLEDGNIACNMPGVFVLEGKLEVELLSDCFQLLINRHESLRTVFKEEGDEVRQVILDPEEFEFSFDHNDISSTENQEALIRAHIKREFIRPFDLTTGLLVRAGLIRQAADKWIFIYVLHHIITDGWSMNNIIQELTVMYNARVKKLENPLKPLRIQYKDFAVWQQAQLSGPDAFVHEEYWLKQLQKRIPLLQLPLDYPRPAIKTFNGRTIHLTLNETITNGLKEIGKEQGGTLFMALLGAINILLYRYTSQTEIIIGTPVAGREHADLEDQIGFYLNTLPLKIKFDGNSRFNDFFKEVSQVTLDAFEHQMYPFDKLIDSLDYRPDLSRNALFDVMMLLQNMNANSSADTLQDVRVYHYRNDEYVISKYDLTFYFTESGDQILTNIEYNVDLFKEETIKDLADYLQVLLEKIVQFPDYTIDQLVDLSLRKVIPSIEFNVEVSDKQAATAHQKRLWFIDQFESGYLYERSPVYHNLPLIAKLTAPINVNLVEKRIQELVRTYPLLSRMISVEKSEPYLSLVPQQAIKLQMNDFGGCADDALISRCRALIQLPFDIEAEPLIRFNLVSYNDGMLFIITAHHLIADRYSLKAIFDLIIKGNVPGAAVQFEQYANWQNGMEEKLQAASSFFWKRKLFHSPVLYLDSNQPRNHIHVYSAGHLQRELSFSAVSGIDELAALLETSPFMILLTAFHILLYRYSEAEELVIGTLYENREREDFKDIIGPLANLITLRNRISDQADFTSLLKQVEADYIASVAAADIPFEKVVLDVNPGKDMSRTALFDVLIHFEDHTGETDEFIEGNDGLGKYDFNLLIKRNEGLSLFMTYNEKYFYEPRVARLLDHYQVIIEQVIENKDCLVAELDFISKAEKDTLLCDFSHEEVDYPKDKTIVGLFEEQVANTPERVAVVFEGVHLTYRELDQRASRLGSYLHLNYEVQPDDLIALKLERGEWMVIAMIAVLKSGGAYVPIDPAYPEERISFMMDDSKCKAVIDQEMLDAFNEWNPENEKLPTIVKAAPGNLAYVIYTSGTTGIPKGTMVEHRNVVRLFKNNNPLFDFNEEDVWTLFHSYCFDFSVWEMYGALLFGGKLIVIPAMTAKDSELFLGVLKTEGVTILNQTPSAFYNLSKYEMEQNAAELRLRYIIFGGEALSADKLSGWNRKYPDVRFINMYGITETTVHVTYKELSTRDIQEGRNSIGKPIPTLSCYIMDKNRQLLPLGITGELYVGGAGVSRGYLNREELTDQRFVSDPNHPGQRLYRSGDKAKFFEDGELEYLGRIDEQVKVRGYRIELGEIENVLRNHEEIEDAVVTTKRDDQGDLQLIAYFTGPQKPDIAALKINLSSQLPEYMLPAYYVPLDYFPITSNGKIDKKNLPDPQILLQQEKTSYTAARNPIEEKLLLIWKDILGEINIDVRDNFFEVGGHSLKATRLVSQIHQVFDVKITLKDIFANPILENQALLIQKGKTNLFYTIPVAPVANDYPLSSSQMGLWILSQTEEGNAAYNIPDSYLLSGQLDIQAMDQAFQSLIERHEILRTVFSENENGEVRQVILTAAQLGLKLNVSDLRKKRAKDKIVSQLIQANFNQTFNLCSGPLIRINLYQLENDKWVFTSVMHHIISDGWSMSVLINELLFYYNAYQKNEPALIAPLRIQFKDYASWQQQQVNSDLFQAHRNYWLEMFSGTLPVLSMPADQLRPAIKTYNGAILIRQIDGEITEAFKALCLKNGSTLFTGLLAAVNVLLYKYSGQTDFITGSPLAGRNHVDLEAQIGFYVSTMALRTKFSEADDFLSLLTNVSRLALGAYDHQLYTFENLIDELEITRNLSRNMLFDVMVALQNTEGLLKSTAGGLNGLNVDRFSVSEHVNSKVDLTFNFVETRKGLQLSLEYNTDIYYKETIERLGRHFVQLLEAVILTPTQSIAGLDYLNPAEKVELISTFNAAALSPASEETIVSAFELSVDERADDIALIYGEKRLTYKALNEKANQLANYLNNNFTIKPNQLIGVKLDRGEWVVIALLAVLKSGAAYVPIDPSYPVERIDFMISDCNCITVIDEDFLHQFWQEAKEFDTQNLSRVHQPEDLAYVAYTSGSTGQPKGVLVRQESVIRLVKSPNYVNVRPDDRVLNLSSFSFDGSVFDIFSALLNGATLVLSSVDILLDTHSLTELIAEEKISVFFVTTALFNVLAESATANFSTLRCVLFGGERVSLHHVKRFRENYKSVKLVHVYGPTENTTFSTYYPITELNEAFGTVPIGAAISHSSCYILGEWNGHFQLKPIGVVGEIFVGGTGLASGYLNQQALTDAKFIDHPFEVGKKVYRTGDYGRWLPDGNIEFTGRIDDQVKVRGYRIEPGEIENALQRFEQVESATVLVSEGADAEKKIVAYFVGNGNISEQELSLWMSSRMPDYMLPDIYLQIERFPLNANGKIDKAKLPVPAMKSGVVYVAPETEIERQLANIWQELLSIEVVGLNDDFFDLGGHSLKATRLSSQIHKTFNVRLPVSVLFSHTTLKEQAHFVKSAVKTSFETISPVALQNNYPLSSGQHRLWVLSQFEEGSIAYHMPGLYLFEGKLDKKALLQAYDLLIARHEILRTTFIEFEDEIRQVIQGPEEVLSGICFHDLRKEQKPEIIVFDLIQNRVMQPFDLSLGPLVHADLYQTADQKWVFAYVMHHIISDGWSMGILIRELLQLYNSCSTGAANPLKPLNIQYKDYAGWERKQLSGHAFQLHKAYWLKKLAGDLPVLQLPTDRPRPAEKTFNGGIVNQRIDKKLTRQLKEFIQDQGATLFMGLQSVVHVLLYHYSGQEDIILGSPVAGRQHSDLENQIGFYVNTLALRTQFKGTDSLKELLANVIDVTVGAFEHQAYPFDELVNDLALTRDTGRSPLFDVLIVLQNLDLFSGEEKEAISGGLTVNHHSGAEHVISKFDLTFYFTEAGEEIQATVEYNTDLFNKETIKRLTGHLVQLLNVLVNHPETPVQQLNYLSATEKVQVLMEFNNTTKVYPVEQSLTSLFEKQVVLTPSKTALIYEESRLSYEELNERANQFANYLISHYRVQEGEVVGIKLERTDWTVVVMIGVLKAVAACLPIDITYPEERIQFMLADSQCRILIDDHELQAFISGRDSYGKNNVTLNTGPNNLTYIIYTSGSTGNPKGCMLLNNGVVNHLFSKLRLLNLNQEDTICHNSELHFVGGIWQLWAPLVVGGQVVLCNHEVLKSIEKLLLTAAEYQSRILEIIPSQLNEYLYEEKQIRFGQVKTLILTGERLNMYFVNKCYDGNPELKIINTYGQTEFSDVTCEYHIPRDFDKASVLIGSPIQNTRIYIMSPAGLLCPVGVIGEIYTGGAGIAAGYINNPELTKEKFVDDPFYPGERVYKTGDLARWLPDGQLEVFGRKDKQVKIRGFRIETWEVENALLAMEEIEEAVILFEEAKNGEKQMIAFIVAQKPLLSRTLHQHLLSLLPRYMMPGKFVQLEKMPLLDNGKTDTKKLTGYQGLLLTSGTEYLAPRNQIEEKLVDLWQHILQREKIGINDDFFELGGHSLKATRLAGQIHKEFGVKITLKELFANTVLLNQTALIQRAGKTTFLTIDSVTVQESYPLSAAQRRLWALSQFDAATVAYNMPGVYKLTGVLDTNALDQAFVSLINRHEILRTVFRENKNEEIHQFILPVNETGFAIAYHDLRSDEQNEQELIQVIQTSFVLPFDLVKGPLLRCTVFQLTDETWILTYVIHHIISDAWSMEILLNEVMSFYNAYHKSVVPVLTPLAIQYKDYAAWQNLQLSGAALNDHKTYWLQQFEGDLPVLKLIGDYPRPEVKKYNGKLISKRFGSEVLQQFKQLGQENSCTLYMSLLGLINVLLYKYTSEEDIIIGSPSAGRDHEDLEHQIGFYINTLAMRTRFKGSWNFVDLLAEIRKLTLDAYEHQVFPFDELVEELHIHRDASRNPLFDVWLVLQDSMQLNMAIAEPDDLKISHYEKIRYEISRYDLHFSFQELGEELQLSLIYNSDIYSEGRVSAMCTHL
ncbi:non-ribosomal peptide synthetase, partial [Pedobacter alluvionis]